MSDSHEWAVYATQMNFTNFQLRIKMSIVMFRDNGLLIYKFLKQMKCTY